MIYEYKAYNSKLRDKRLYERQLYKIIDRLISRGLEVLEIKHRRKDSDKLNNQFTLILYCK